MVATICGPPSVLREVLKHQQISQVVHCMLWLVFPESVFELVSGEDRAKMDAAKMQADLAQSQQQKQIPSSTDGSLTSGGADGRDGSESGALFAGLASTVGSEAVSRPEKTDNSATGTPLSSQPSLSRSGFTPFAKNPAKQQRYEAYLVSLKAGTTCKSTASFEVLFLT